MILDIYLDSRFLRQTKETVRNPYQYMRAVNGMSKAQYQVRYHDVEKKYNAAVVQMQGYEPIEFLSQYVAYCAQSKNDSGLENGMIYERFLGGIHSDSQKGCANQRIIIVDAAPLFIDQFVKDERTRDYDVTFCFCDRRLADIYKTADLSGRFRWSNLEELTGTEQLTRILVFGAARTDKEVKRIISNIRMKFMDSYLRYVFLLLPTAYYDRRNEDESLRSYIHQEFWMRQVVLIDPEAVNIPPKKRSMLVLVPKTRKVGERVESIKPISMVSMQMARMGRVGKKQFLDCSEESRTPIGMLLDEDKTIHTQYNRALRGYQDSPKRAQPKRYSFTKEIDIWYSVTNMKNGCYRGKFHFYDYPDASALRKNHLHRGKKLKTNISGKVVKLLDDVRNNAENLPFIHDELAQTIRTAVTRRYGNQSVALKTFWYLMLPELMGREDYEEDICNRVFRKVDSGDEPLCALRIENDCAERLEQAVALIQKELGLSETWIRVLWGQLKIIFGLAAKMKMIVGNPVLEIVDEIDSRKGKIYELRDAMALRSLTIAEEERLHDVLADDENAVMALMVALKYYTGMSSGEICALTLGDVLSPHGMELKLLRINKSLDQTGMEPKGLRSKWCYRLLAIPKEISTRLDRQYREVRGRLRSMGVAEKDMARHPIFGKPGNPTNPILTRRLNEYCAKIIGHLGRQGIILELPQENGMITTDVGAYYGDFLQANFEYYAMRTAGFTEDEICYYRGRKPTTVLAKHYYDFTKATRQLAMRVKLGRWVSLGLPEYQEIDRSIHNFTCEEKVDFYATPYCEPTELVVDLVLPTCADKYVEVEVFARFGLSVEFEIIVEDGK